MKYLLIILTIILTGCFRQLNKTPVSWIVKDQLNDSTYYCISTDSVYDMYLIYYDELEIGEVVSKFIELPNGKVYKKHFTEETYNNIHKESELKKH